MGTWAISTDGETWLTLANAGISNMRLTLRANGVDELIFSVPGDALAAAAFAFDEDIILKHDDTIRYRGRISTVPRQAMGPRESISYGAVAGWWWLEQITYAQTWQMLRTSDNELAPVPKPRIVIGQDDSGTRRTLAQEIEAVIDFAIAAGAPLLKGTIDVGPMCPLSEHTNMRCADVLLQCLRLMPDRVCWFDHSTSPYPTFHCRSIDNLTSANIDIVDTNAESIELRPRYDMQLPGLRILYELANSHDGYDFASYSLDTAGDLEDPRCLDLLFELGGSSETFLTQEVETADYPPAPYTDKAFWVSMFDFLASIEDDDLTINDVTRGGEHNYDRFLVKGCIQDWMSVGSEDEPWAVSVSYIRRDGDGAALEKVESKKLYITLRSTVATSRKYRKLASYQAAEAVPTGVAAALYASWGRLQWEGVLSLVEEEATLAVGPWSKVNLLNGLAGWATMAAACQELSVDVESGTSRLQLGPSGRLEGETLVALFRAAHARRYSYRAPQRADATVGGAETEGSYRLPREKASEADPGETRQLKVAASVGVGEAVKTHTIQLDPSTVAHADAEDEANRTMQPREVLIPEITEGAVVLRRCQILASASYHTGAPSQPVEEWTCAYTSGLVVSVTPGDIPWSTESIVCAKTESTPPEPLAIPVDFADVPLGERRWIFAEINFGTKTCTAKLAPADNVMVLNDPKNLISVRNLTLWERTATGLKFIRTHLRGGITLGCEEPPPLR